MSFSSLKQNKSAAFSKLQKSLEQTTQVGSVDERFWKPVTDKAGNGFAVIRFLPACDGEDMPFVKMYSHAFQGPGGWFIENSLTTLGQKDPVGEYNRSLWNSGDESLKDQVRKQKRKLEYYSNILVVSDPKHPENEGKVFLYKYGKKIHDKIIAAMQPEFQDESPVNVFDFWEGANFKLKIRTVAGYWNYDASEFTAPAALSPDDDEMEAIWKQAYSLEAFTAPSEFKEYDAVENRLNAVLGLSAPRPVQQAQEEEEQDPAPIGGFNDSDITVSSSESFGSSSTDDDDALSYFQKLAEE